MGLKLLTELLELPGYFVKEITRRDKEIILTVEREGYPECPECGQAYLDVPKDRRYQEVEDLSIFGKRCYLKVLKYRINCSCGYNGTEHFEWLDRYQRFTVRYRKWIYAFLEMEDSFTTQMENNFTRASENTIPTPMKIPSPKIRNEPPFLYKINCFV